MKALVIIAGTLLVSGITQAAEIQVLASNATKEAYLELVPQFEKTTEHKVTTTWSGTVDIKKRLAAGETYDVLIMAGPEIDEFIRQGKLVAGSRVDLAKSGVGVAVRTGASKPDISSADGLKAALLSAKSIGYSQGPSGTYLVGLFQRMGIADTIKDKVKVSKVGQPVGNLIASGEVEIGFQQVSELLPVKGIDFLGPLPASVQQITTFSGGLFAAAKQPEAAKALVTFLAAPAATPVKRKHGLDGLPLDVERTGRGTALRLTVPVAGVAIVAFHTVQIGVHPGRLARTIVHRDPVRLLPIALLRPPQRLQRRADRFRRHAVRRNVLMEGGGRHVCLVPEARATSLANAFTWAFRPTIAPAGTARPRPRSPDRARTTSPRRTAGR
jgi:molybdate transport system substrate-binding protein